MQTVSINTVTTLHLSSQVRVNGLDSEVLDLMLKSIPTVGQLKPILVQLIDEGLVSFFREYIGEDEANWLEDQWKNKGKLWLIVNGNHRFEAIRKLSRIHPSDHRFSNVNIEVDPNKYASNVFRKIAQWKLNKGVGHECAVNDEETTVSLLVDMVEEDYFGKNSMTKVKNPKTVNVIKDKVRTWLDMETKGTTLSEKKMRERIIAKTFDVHLNAAQPPLVEKRYTTDELNDICEANFGVKSGNIKPGINGNMLYYVVTHNDVHKKSWDWVSKMAACFNHGKVSSLPFKVCYVYAVNGNADIRSKRKEFVSKIKKVNEFSRCNFGGDVVTEVYNVGQLLTGKNKEVERSLIQVKI